MASQNVFTVAAIQAAPCYFDKAASTEKACRLIGEAASKGAVLAAFSETWLPGYPFFHSTEGSELKMRAKVEYINQAVTIPGPETDALCTAARENGIDVAIGVAELDPYSQASVYCSLLFISSDGEILGHHRKLKPTDGERTVWADGDGAGLNVYQRPYARISGLNCWEHMMMLPSYTLAAQGTQVHVAVWPTLDGESNGPLLSQAFAMQTGSYVVSVGGLRSPDDLPDEFRELAPEGFGKTGGSRIVDPWGKLIAGPVENEEEILLAECDLENSALARSFCDIGGHYSRPDVFDIRLNRSRRKRINNSAD